MKVAIWDTYVTKKDGSIMHFDIIVSEEQKNPSVIYAYGKEYLKSKGQEDQQLTSQECRFCHIDIPPIDWKLEIIDRGYYILEMENCL